MAASKNRIDELVAAQVCPITQEPMEDPVIAADGHTYERAAIEKWFATSNMSPMTGVVLEHTGLIPNHAFRSLVTNITEFTAEQGKAEAASKIEQDVKQSSAALPAGGSTPTTPPNTAEKGEKDNSAVYLSDIEDDKRFERSDKPGVMYEVYSGVKISDAVLIAYKIDPLQCVRGIGEYGIHCITIYDSKETAAAARLSLVTHEENRVALASSMYEFHAAPLPCPPGNPADNSAVYLRDIEDDKRFVRSNSPGVMYEIDSSVEVSDAELKAYKIDPLQCVRRKDGLYHHMITVYDSKETAAAARLSLVTHEENRVALAASRYQFHAPPQVGVVPIADNDSESNSNSSCCVLL